MTDNPFGNYINGEWVPAASGKTFENHNPADTSDLVGRFAAGDLIRELAKEVGGTGGGRPDFAQAGGPDAGKLDAALARLAELLPNEPRSGA